MSRGSTFSLGASAKKGLALFWTALLLSMLLTQYLTATAPAVVRANATGNKLLGGFELDGNLYSGNMTPSGDDWAKGASGSGLLTAPSVQDPVGNTDTTNFSVGSKENDSPSTWSGGTGTASPKDDIGNVYVGSQLQPLPPGSNSHLWSFLALERDSNSGTTYYDFEFNQKPNVTNAQGISVPNRSVGDVLIVAQQQGAGPNATFDISATIQKWTGSAWSAPVAPVAGSFYGISNDAAIPVGPWSDNIASGTPATIPQLQFAEMAFDFTANGLVLSCPSAGFGEVNVRTRSSISSTAALKDYTAAPVSIPSNCASLSWQKQDGAGNPLGGATFTVSPDPSSTNGTGSIDVTDNKSPDTDGRAGYFHLANVVPGTYTVTEKTAPAGYLLDPTSKTITLTVFQDGSISYIWKNPAKVPPTITTTSSASTADFGAKVHDSATLTGDGKNPVTGTVDFFLCHDASANPDCSTGGTQVGGDVAVTGGSATSADYTVGLTKADAGYYCWRAEYTPDSSSVYLAGSHTNTTTECFYVAPATISITKTANPAGPVNAGDPIGFDITVTNTGTTTTLGVHMTDTLPAGVDWTADAPTGAAASCSITSGVLTCDAATLSAKQSFSIHLHGLSSPAVCGTVSNTASVGTSNDGSADATASVVVNCPALGITKTADATTVNAGDPIGFTVTVQNNGAGAAYNATLHDPLPAGVTWTVSPAVQGCSITGGVLDCTIGDMAPSGTFSVHVSAQTSYAACSTYDNTATAKADNAPQVSASASIACQEPGLTITKTADATTVNAGDKIGFTIEVGNSGPGTAKAVTLHDPLPAGVTWTVDPAVTGCSITSGTLDCTIGDMAAEDTFSVHVSAQTSYEACSTYNNTATASADNAPDVSASASIACQKPSLSITKTADAATVNAGDKIGFTITVSNAGPGVAKSVVLHDPLPAGVAWAVDPAVQGCSISSGTLDCSIGDMASGASASVHVSAQTSAAACSKYDNTATASASNAPSVNASASIVCQTPDVTVLKTADATPISAGDTAGFTMVVTNNGPGTAYKVTLHDPLPANVSWAVDPAVEGCSISNGTLDCSLGDMASGTSISVHVTGKASAAACGELPNTATVAASNEPSANTENNRSSASITVVCPPVSIVKQADAKTVNAGDPVGFTITVSNNSDYTALNVSVDDVLPSNGGLGWSIDAANTDAGFSISNGHLVLATTSLAAGASLKAHIVSGTTPATCGTVDNTATLSYNGGTGSSEDSVQVECPDLAITKTAGSSPILAGQTASYTITVTNLGPGAAYGVTVHDPLPSGIDWTADNEACSIANGALDCTVSTLAKGATFTVTLSGGTTAAQCGELPNTATVAAANEPASNTDNNQSSASITVQCASITLVKTAGDAADGATLLLASPGDVVYTYVVTNTGTADLGNLALVDDNGTPNDTSDDVAVTCPATTLAAGASMTCHATLPVGYGTRVNVATVTAHPVLSPEGTVSATDDATVEVPQPTPTPTPVGTVLSETATPQLTLPATDSLGTGSAGNSSGNGLLLVLGVIGLLLLVVGLAAPAPARARRRTRRR